MIIAYLIVGCLIACGIMSCEDRKEIMEEELRKNDVKHLSVDGALIIAYLCAVFLWLPILVIGVVKFMFSKLLTMFSK